MSTKLIGTFVYNNDGDGCLTSKYINNIDQEPNVECSKIKRGITQNGFEGTYLTSWIQKDGNCIKGELVIKEAKSNYYELSWFDVTGKKVFEGIGMVHQDDLVGSYWIL